MKPRFSIAFVVALGALVCLAYPHRTSGDKIKGGSYMLVMGKGPVPSFMKMQVTSAPPNWMVKGTYSNQRISLALEGKLMTSTKVLSGKATPANGYSGAGCDIKGGWGNDSLRVRLGPPYNLNFDLKYQKP